MNCFLFFSFFFSVTAQRNLSAVQFLLKHGANPGLASATGRTAFMLAEETDEEIAHAFHLGGARVEKRLHSASSSSSTPSSSSPPSPAKMRKRRVLPAPPVASVEYEDLGRQAKRPRLGKAELFKLPSALQDSEEKGSVPLKTSRGRAAPVLPPPSSLEQPTKKTTVVDAVPATRSRSKRHHSPEPEAPKPEKKASRRRAQALPDAPVTTESESVRRRKEKGKQKEAPATLLGGLVFPPSFAGLNPPSFYDPLGYELSAQRRMVSRPAEPDSTRNQLYEIAQERRGERGLGGGGYIQHRIKQDLEKEGFCPHAFEDEYSGGFGGGRIIDVVSHVVF